MMIEPFIGHKPHVAPPSSEEELLALLLREPESVVENADVSRDPKEKYFFIWVDGYKGNGFVYASEFEAKIVVEDFLPKIGLLRKVELAADDKRTIDELKLEFPWPVLPSMAVVSNYVPETFKPKEIDFPAMYGGATDAQG